MLISDGTTWSSALWDCCFHSRGIFLWMKLAHKWSKTGHLIEQFGVLIMRMIKFHKCGTNTLERTAFVKVTGWVWWDEAHGLFSFTVCEQVWKQTLNWSRSCNQAGNRSAFSDQEFLCNNSHLSKTNWTHATISPVKLIKFELPHKSHRIKLRLLNIFTQISVCVVGKDLKIMKK